MNDDNQRLLCVCGILFLFFSFQLSAYEIVFTEKKKCLLSFRSNPFSQIVCSSFFFDHEI